MIKFEHLTIGMVLIVGFLVFVEITNTFTISKMGLLFTGFLLVLLGIWEIFRQRWEDDMLYVIERTPPTEIHDLEQDVTAKVDGRISAERKLTSACGLKQCVYYRSIRDEYQPSGKHHKWIRVIDETDTLPFYLADKTGKVQIDLSGIDPDWLDAEMTLDKKTSDYEYYYSEDGIGYNVREREWTLSPGDRLFVYGKVRSNDSGLVICADYKERLVASVKTQKEFVKKIRRDDKHQIAFAYGIMLLGCAVIVWSFFKLA